MAVAIMCSNGLLSARIMVLCLCTYGTTCSRYFLMQRKVWALYWPNDLRLKVFLNNNADHHMWFFVMVMHNLFYDLLCTCLSLIVKEIWQTDSISGSHICSFWCALLIYILYLLKIKVNNTQHNIRAASKKLITCPVNQRWLNVIFLFLLHNTDIQPI